MSSNWRLEKSENSDCAPDFIEFSSSTTENCTEPFFCPSSFSASR